MGAVNLHPLAAVKHEDIDFSDIPELDEEFWERAVIVEPDLTDQITMRVKRSVLAYFKAPGKKGYQTRMNRAPRARSVRHRTGDRSPSPCCELGPEAQGDAPGGSLGLSRRPWRPL